MAAQTSMLHVRVDGKLKADATENLSDVSLPISGTVRIFLNRVIKEGDLHAGLTTNQEAHNKWFRAKVHEVLADSQLGVLHQQVIDEAQALIDRKCCARA